MLSIERSGYYAWLNRRPGKREMSNNALDRKIIAIFRKHKSRYGAKRLTDELRVAESFFHSLKVELVCTERYATREMARQSIFQYIEVYYNCSSSNQI